MPKKGRKQLDTDRLKKKPPSLTAFAREIRPRITPDPIRPPGKVKGKKTGYGIMHFWHSLLQLNEHLPRNRKMTNAELERQWLLEFPHRSETIKRQIAKSTGANLYRHLYNTSRLCRNVVSPCCSFRYNDKGEQVDGRTGRIILTAVKKQAVLQRYGFDSEGEPQVRAPGRLIKRRKKK